MNNTEYNHEIGDVIPACGYTHDEIFQAADPIVDRIVEDVYKDRRHNASRYIEEIEKSIGNDPRKAMVVTWILASTVSYAVQRKRADLIKSVAERIVMVIVAVILLLFAIRLTQ